MDVVQRYGVSAVFCVELNTVILIQIRFEPTLET